MKCCVVHPEKICGSDGVSKSETKNHKEHYVTKSVLNRLDRFINDIIDVLG